MNEHLRNSDGSWSPQPFDAYAELGITVEEVALRVIGYLNLFLATGDETFEQRSLEGAEYLLGRQYENGHFLLQAHTAIDITYAFGGLALLHAWKISGDEKFLRGAENAGNQLVAFGTSLSVNHAATPAWLLCPLYRVTGDTRFLDNAERRVRKSALWFQLPYGGWPGHESWIWYHAITTRALAECYQTTPFTPRWRARKDDMASALAAAINRFVGSQLEDGSLRPGRGDRIYDELNINLERSAADYAIWRDGEFVRSPERSLRHLGYPLECLVFLQERIPAKILGPVTDGVAAAMMREEKVYRLHIDTFGFGSYLRAVRGVRPLI